MRPWKETLRNAQELLQRSTGPIELFQQWNCAHCLHKNTMAEANTFFTQGYCDRCDHLTNIQEAGHGFAIVVSVSPRMQAATASHQGRSQPQSPPKTPDPDRPKS